MRHIGFPQVDGGQRDPRDLGHHGFIIIIVIMTIIEGVAQGLLYLHKYYRFAVVYRDFKSSNILLDDDLNPKISDFGLARIFGRNDFEANTSKIMGT